MNVNKLNWARNFEYGAREIHSPSSVGEVQELVGRSSKLKALGTRHSFSQIADTDGDLVSTENLNKVLELDRNAQTVRIEAGIRYGELSQFLDSEGFALHNLASLPHISVGGACATATHGSGVSNCSLASTVVELTFVSADGSLVSLSKKNDPDEFAGAVVALGALGVVTELTLDVEPAYRMSQIAYDNLPFEKLEKHFEEIMSAAYSVSLFTYWTSDQVNQVWVKRRETDDVDKADLTRFGAVPANGKRSPLPDGAVENCTEQGGAIGPWWDRLPHFRLGFTPSSGEELQTEYFVAREHAWEALQLVNGIRDEVAPLLHTTEVRTIAADEFWMSPCYQQDSVAIHFTWKKDWERVLLLLPKIEALLAPYNPRPHWGKLSTVDPMVLQSRYPALGDFRNLVAKYDPEGKFRNPFLDQIMEIPKSL